VAGASSLLCPMANFGTSGLEALGSDTIMLVTFYYSG
jgi:hypothetical protein